MSCSPEKRPGSIHGPPAPPEAPNPRYLKPAEPARRCRQCGKLVESEENEPYYQRTGLCFWCAHVDPQG